MLSALATLSLSVEALTMVSELVYMAPPPLRILPRLVDKLDAADPYLSWLTGQLTGRSGCSLHFAFVGPLRGRQIAVD
jgi:hypothetical protein